MQIDWWTLALQAVNFGIVVWLLSRLLYQPIKRVIEDREATDRKAAETAEEKTRAAEQARKEFEAKLAELAEAQRQEEARLHAEMDRERQDMLEAAEKKAAALVAQARDRIERERKQALDDLGDQIADLARDLARKALGDGALAGDGLLAQVEAHIGALSAPDLAELRADAAGDANGVCLVTANPLSEAQRTAWRDAMAPRFPDAAIAFETDASILGGAELRFPHAVLSFSVADRLDRAAADLKG